MNTPFRRIRGSRGFSIIDVVATLALIGTLSVIAVPQVSNVVDRMRLGMSERDVERELQFARLKSVATQRVMRVRFDCPSAGRVRVVELLGTPTAPEANDADAVLSRCSDKTYPYSPTGADKSRLTRPNNDGPVRTLFTGTTFTAKQTLEFWPNGTVHTACQAACGSAPQIGTVTLTLRRKGISRNIKVNGLGKIRMDR
jgi:Tfp pilus assembly protein FimT